MKLMTAKRVWSTGRVRLVLSVAALATVSLACSSSPRPPSAPAGIQTNAASANETQLATGPDTSIPGSDAEDLISLSRQKWLWMAERKLEPLENLFHEEAVFVHMGGTMTKRQELEVIERGAIHYKHAEIQEISVRFVGATAILLGKIRLDAVVGGNEVSNPFTVTEVYVRRGASWTLGAMSFTRLLTQ